jgi:hypothetical protein
MLKLEYALWAVDTVMMDAASNHRQKNNTRDRFQAARLGFGTPL